MRLITATAALTLMPCALAGTVTTAAQTKPPAASVGAPSDAKTVSAFNERLRQYSELHNTLEKTLQPLPKDASPEAIDQHQRALEALVKKARASAKRGDLFAPDTEKLIRRMLVQILSGAEGAKLKATIMDENPTTLALAVNSRYPDEVPLSTMPPQVLALLPKLPEDLEYRFIGPRLILLDVHAHTIVDYIENALP